MFLVDHGLLQSDESDIILESCRIVVGVNLLPLNLIVLVGQLLALVLDVPLAQPDLHLVHRVTVDTVSGRDDPVFTDQSSATGDSLGAEEASLDKGSAPRMRPEFCVVTSHYPRLTSRQPLLSALGVLDGAQRGVDIVHLLPVHTAGPDHASIAEIHRLLAPEDAGGGEVTIVLSTPVPENTKVSGWVSHQQGRISPGDIRTFPCPAGTD